MNRKLKRLILLALLRCDGMPMPEEALFAGVQVMCRPERVTLTDIGVTIKDLEAAGFIAGVTDEITGTNWGLTDKGQLKAAQL